MKKLNLNLFLAIAIILLSASCNKVAKSKIKGNWNVKTYTITTSYTDPQNLIPSSSHISHYENGWLVQTFYQADSITSVDSFQITSYYFNFMNNDQMEGGMTILLDDGQGNLLPQAQLETGTWESLSGNILKIDYTNTQQPIEYTIESISNSEMVLSNSEQFQSSPTIGSTNFNLVLEK